MCRLVTVIRRSSVKTAGRVNPSLPREGKRPVRAAGGAAGRGRGSKRRPPGNRADRGWNSTPPVRELTSLWSGGTRNLGPPLWEAEQMTAAARLAGAASPGNRKRPRASSVQVRRLVAGAASGRSNRAFARLKLHALKGCAAERGAESLTQSGGTWRNVPGSSGLPEGESKRGKGHARKAGGTGRC